MRGKGRGGGVQHEIEVQIHLHLKAEIESDWGHLFNAMAKSSNWLWLIKLANGFSIYLLIND